MTLIMSFAQPIKYHANRPSQPTPAWPPVICEKSWTWLCIFHENAEMSRTHQRLIGPRRIKQSQSPSFLVEASDWARQATP